MPNVAVLLVCAANRCRSPLAASILWQLVGERTTPNTWRVASAGLYAQTGQPVTRFTEEVAREHGLDLTSHRSQSIADVRLDTCRAILVMEEVQGEALTAAWPHLAPRVRRLSDLIGLHVDIADPTGHGLAEHRAAYRQIDRCLRVGFPRLLEIVGEDIASSPLTAHTPLRPRSPHP